MLPPSLDHEIRHEHTSTRTLVVWDLGHWIRDKESNTIYYTVQTPNFVLFYILLIYLHVGKIFCAAPIIVMHVTKVDHPYMVG